MSQWLKRRLIAGFCGLALMGSGATYLQAQSPYPAPAKTPEAASEQFAQFLVGSNEQSETYYPPFGSVRDRGSQRLQNGAISRRNVEALDQGMAPLLGYLARASRLPRFNARVVSNDGQNALVEVVPSPEPKPLPLIVVAEDGGWRVDAIATYARLNNLQGVALTENLSSLTGVIPKGFPASANLLRSQCQSNLKQIGLGIAQYVQDYDEVMPRAREWTEILQPYLKSHQIFTCPSVPSGQSHGYAFNSLVSQVPINRISNLSGTVSVYETSNLGGNVFGPGTGRAYRHAGGANYAFADGHVKWLSQSDNYRLNFKP